MRDWAREYILHVLEKKDWSAHRLAEEAGVASSTINRPLNQPDWPHKLSRTTLIKIRAASGIDPGPFIPDGFEEDREMFARRSEPRGEQSARPKMSPEAAAHGQPDFVLTIDDGQATISARITLQNIDKMREKLDLIEKLLSA